MFWTNVTKGSSNAVRLQTIDRDGISEILNAGSTNLRVSAHPSYLYVSNFHVSDVYIQQQKHTTNYKLSTNMNPPTRFSDKPPFSERYQYKGIYT